MVPKSHPLRLLSDRINWDELEGKFLPLYSPNNGRPGISIRTLIGLQLLKYIENESDEKAVKRLSENAPWQYFCGKRYYECKKCCDATTLVKFRQKIGEEGLNILLAETVRIGKSEKIFKSKDLDKIHVDTTVQEKNITYPHDVKHLVKVHGKLLKALLKKKISVKQTYRFIMKKHYRWYFKWSKCNRYKVANGYKRKMCTNLGRLVRDVKRRISGDDVLEAYFSEILRLCEHFILQARSKCENSEKLYSPHEQHVQCIAKGKVNKKYEYGNKVSFVTTDRTNFIVGCASHQGRPHDSKTLRSAVQSVERITGILPSGCCAVDLGYRGHEIRRKELFVIHPRLTKLKPFQRKLVRRRSKSESVISFVKRRCRMGVNYLKGIVGDSVNALSAACAYNAKLIMRVLEARAVQS